jgi:D-glycero-D-manno-heptose 1,7-bisphosphate phosphatase
MNKAVFLDKDGVVTVDKDNIESLTEMEFLPGIADAIALFRKRGYMIFIVTNQPIVARGTIAESILKIYLDRIPALLKKMNKEALIDKIYYCPHHPHANVEKYRVDCDCRKPKPGMLLKAAKEFDVDLKASFMVGDRMSDVIAGYLAGCRTIQCLTGKENVKMIETDLKIPDNIKPDFVVKDIYALKDIIL